MNYTIPLPPMKDRPPLWSQVALWFTRVLALVAFSSGLYLSWRSTQAGPVPGCGGSTFDCDHVVTSAWSRWMGIPVSYLGCATYLALLVGLCLIRTPPFTSEVIRARQRLAWTFIVPLAVMASLSAIWFTYLQLFEIGKLCPYCLVTHGCGLMLSIVVAVLLLPRYMRANTTSEAGNRTWMSILVTGGVLGAASLVLGQQFFPHSTMVIVDEVQVSQTSNAATFGAPGQTNADTSTDDDQFFMAAPGTTAPGITESGTEDTVQEGIDGKANSTANRAQKNIGATTEDSSVDTTSESLDDDLADIASAPVVAEKTSAVGRHRFYFFMRSDPIDAYEYPILGSPDAKYLIVEVVDYTCHHCREMYHHVEAARQHYGDDLAVLVRPVALEKQCNPYLKSQLPAHVNACRYARLALAIWTVSPNKFSEFHHWLLGPETIPSLESAAAFANELIGADALREAIQSREALDMLGENHRLWNGIGGTLPYVFAGRRLIQGMPRDDKDFIKTLDSLLGVTP